MTHLAHKDMQLNDELATLSLGKSRIMKEDLLLKQDRLKHHGKCGLIPQRLESSASN